MVNKMILMKEEAEDNHTLYVRINHATLMVIDRVKMPNLFAFVEKHIEEMMEFLQKDIVAMKAYYEKHYDPKHPDKEILPYKTQIPVKYISKSDWDILTVGIPHKPVKFMTLCFGMKRLLCDLRIRKEDVIKENLNNLAQRGFLGAPDDRFKKKKSKLILPPDLQN